MKRIVRVRTCTSLEEMELKYIFVNKNIKFLNHFHITTIHES